jgi:hypothetical protein
MADKIQIKGDYTLHDIIITTKTGEHSIKKHFQGASITSSIDNVVMYGSLNMKDTLDMVLKSKLNGGEKLTIEYQVSNDDKIKHNLIVLRVQDGTDDIRLSVGLWDQLDNSYRRIYNRSSFSLDLFKSEIFNFYNGKVDFKGPDPQRQIIVQTGMGGMKLVNAAILAEANGAGLVTNAVEMSKSGIGAISGKAMDLDFGFAFTSYTIPFLANVKFVLNPAFDNVHTNDIENPVIDGFPLSSYNFIVFDITDNTNDNIYLLKNKWDNELKWWYQNGTMDYMGRTQGFQSSGQFNGYRVMMTQCMPAIWIKDPTKVLKIVMRNPITGGSY